MIFKPAARYPADPRAVFILALCVFSGVIALALGAKPGSLEEVLPGWAVFVWGASLVAGSATALAGMAFQSVNGIITEQVGSMTVAMATIFYSIVMVWVAGSSAYFSAMIILGWGIACFLRWVQLQILIETAYRKKIKQEIIAEIRKHGSDPS